MMETPEPIFADACNSSVDLNAKDAMLTETLHELCGAYIETCRRRLRDEEIESLLQGLRQFVGSLDAIHLLVPGAQIMQRATRAAEYLAKRAIDVQLESLQNRIAAHVAALRNFSSMQQHPQRELATDKEIAIQVRDALSAVAPLLTPLAELLPVRADSIAKHLIAKLYHAVRGVAVAALKSTADARCVLARAKLCYTMVSTGLPQVSAMLKAHLSPEGLGGFALGFDVTSVTREMQETADALLERFVKLQAQQMSRALSTHMQSTDWFHHPPPEMASRLIETTFEELSEIQSLATQILPGEHVRSLLPHGPFPSTSTLASTAIDQRSSHLETTSAIQKDLQRLFARKISLGVATVGDRTSVPSMLTHVTKLALKTLIEEIRIQTFSCAGFQQLQVDFAMLRWALSSHKEDDGSISALLDEALISCQERCLDPVPVATPVLAAICEEKCEALRKHNW